MKQTNSPFLNGIPELLILQNLREKEMYGYELVEAIRASSGDEIILAEGVIYPILHMLERDGALASRRQTVNGRRRIYYALTPSGTSRLEKRVDAWRRLTTAIAAMLQEPAHA